MSELNKLKNQKKRVEKLIAKFTEDLNKNPNLRHHKMLIEGLNMNLTGQLTNRERANLIDEKRRDLKKEHTW